MHRRTVGAEELRVVLQEPEKPLPVDVGPAPVVARAHHARPEQRIQVHRPADVVVEVPAVPVGVPAVPDVPVLDPVQVALDVVAVVRGAHRGEELLGHHLEEPPVVVPGAAADKSREPVDDPLLDAGVQLVPDPGAGLVQPHGDRGRFDHLLRAVGEFGPGLGRPRVGAGCQTLRVALDQFRVDVALGSGDPEGRHQEGACVALEPVRHHPRPTGPAGQPVLGEARGRVRHERVEHAVGRDLPVGARPAGPRGQQPVGRRKVHEGRGHAGGAPQSVRGDGSTGGVGGSGVVRAALPSAWIGYAHLSTWKPVRS